MNSTVDWEELSLEASQDRRRERRIPLAFSIEVSGFDQGGRFFTARTVTTDISESGCRFGLNVQLDRGAVVAMKLVNRDSSRAFPERPLLFQVARVSQEGNGWVVGAVKLQPESLWCVAFPSAGKHPTSVV